MELGSGAESETSLEGAPQLGCSVSKSFCAAAGGVVLVFGVFGGAVPDKDERLRLIKVAGAAVLVGCFVSVFAVAPKLKLNWDPPEELGVEEGRPKLNEL